MNKLKKMLCIIVASFAAITSYASTATDYTDIVYAKDVKASLGGMVEVPIYLKNLSYPVKSLQFSMELPEGISFVEEDGVGHKFSKNSLSNNWTISFRTKDGEAANTGLAMMSYQNDATTIIPEGNVEVFKIHLLVTSNTSAGTKNIIMRGITLTDGAGTEHTILKGNQTITSNVNIQRADIVEKQDEDFCFEILPIAKSTIGNMDLMVRMKNKYDVAGFSMTVEYPEGIAPRTGRGVKPTVVKDNLYSSTDPNIAALSIAQSTNGTVTSYTVSNADVDTYLAKNEYYDAFSLPLSITEDNKTYNLKFNVGTITVYNTEADPDLQNPIEIGGGQFLVTVTVGTPIDKNPIIYGDITEALTVIAAIPDDVTSVDISQATATDAVIDEIVENAQAKSPNVVVYAPDTYKGDKNNVVTEDANGALTCSSFVVTDGVALDIPASFSAESATYNREMPNNWGTIILPYDVSSNSNIAYYLPSVIEDGVLKLTRQETLSANTPAIIAKGTGSSITVLSSDVNVSTDTNSSVSGTVTMHGSYTNNTKVDTANAYYIFDNKFWLCNDHFFIDAFRAYFTVEGALAKQLSISTDTITALSDLITEEDVTIEGYYDLSGKRQESMHEGLNIIKLSNGKNQKVLIQ